MRINIFGQLSFIICCCGICNCTQHVSQCNARTERVADYDNWLKLKNCGSGRSRQHRHLLQYYLNVYMLGSGRNVATLLHCKSNNFDGTFENECTFSSLLIKEHCCDTRILAHISSILYYFTCIYILKQYECSFYAQHSPADKSLLDQMRSEHVCNHFQNVLLLSLTYESNHS